MGKEIAGSEVNLKQLIGVLVDWIKFFFTKWIFIGVIALLGAAAGYFYGSIQKPEYVAELTVALEEKGMGNAYAGIASQFGVDLGGSDGGAFAGDNVLELMKSKNLIEKTLLTPVVIDGQEQLLVNRYISFAEICEDWKDDPRLSGVRFTKDQPHETFTITQDSLLKLIYKELKKQNLIVNKFDKKLKIIYVQCKIEDQLFAKYFTEILVKNVSDFYTETKTKNTRINVMLLEHRVDSIKKELDSEIYGAAVLKDQNMNIFRAQGNVQSAKKQMNVQVLTTMYGELVKNLELSKFTLMREEPLFQVIDTPILPLDNYGLKPIMGMIIGIVVFSILGFIYLIVRRSLSMSSDPE
jgi:hypothetical protein